MGTPPTTPAITPPPSSGTTASISITAAPETSLSPATEIVFQNDTYILPRSGTVELLQTDGSTATLAPGFIIAAGVTLAVPSVSSPTSLSSGSLTINAQPGTAVSPPTGGGASGFVGLINALEGLAGSATPVVDTLNQIFNDGAEWAAGGISDASLGPSIGDSLGTGMDDLAAFMSSVSGVADSFGDGPWLEMTEGARGQVVSAYDAAAQEFDISRALRKLVANFKYLSPRVVAALRQVFVSSTAIGLIATLNDFAKYDWAGELPAVTSLNSTSNSTFSARRTKTSTSSSTSSASATASPYIIRTKQGTPWSTFQNLAKSVDGYQGNVIAYPRVPWFTYVSTNITATQAKAVSSLDFVLAVVAINAAGHGELDIAQLGSSEETLRKRVNPSDIEIRPNSDSHLRIISFPDQKAMNGPLPDYQYDYSSGQNQTVYIVGSGCLLTHDVSRIPRGVINRLPFFFFF